eukprot:GHVU01101906.1.p1 GENE.GHVU01101906.1~~GHVU01101906.1.p1  ORF type:complete len:103 (-),score=1.82 GHVU01101906.1:81-389(-)
MGKMGKPGKTGFSFTFAVYFTDFNHLSPISIRAIRSGNPRLGSPAKPRFQKPTRPELELEPIKQFQVNLALSISYHDLNRRTSGPETIQTGAIAVQPMHKKP